MSTNPSLPVHDAIACLQRLTEVFQARRRQLAQVAGLTEQQWAVLEQISTEHFMPSMFAKSRASSAAAVSKILRQLLDKRLIISRVGVTDARLRQYELTAKGQRTIGLLRQQRETAIATIWAPLPPADLEHFTRFGTLLTDRLEKYALTVHH